MAPPLAPGFVTREPMPLGPRVSHDGLFTALADESARFLGDSDGPLGAMSTRVGEPAMDDFDAAYATTIGHAADVLAQQVGAGVSPIPDQLVAAGGGVDAYHSDVLRYLPQPDAPIETGFLPPPDPVTFIGPRPPREPPRPPRLPPEGQPAPEPPPPGPVPTAPPPPPPEKVPQPEPAPPPPPGHTEPTEAPGAPAPEPAPAPAPAPAPEPEPREPPAPRERGA